MMVSGLCCHSVMLPSSVLVVGPAHHDPERVVGQPPKLSQRKFPNIGFAPHGTSLPALQTGASGDTLRPALSGWPAPRSPQGEGWRRERNWNRTFSAGTGLIQGVGTENGPRRQPGGPWRHKKATSLPRQLPAAWLAGPVPGSRCLRLSARPHPERAGLDQTLLSDRWRS